MLVNRLVIEKGRAVGVALGRSGGEEVVHASREVILSAGAINSPQIRMLSGLGPADQLAEHGISPVLYHPGIGQNLQDHLTSMVEFRRTAPGPFQREMRYDRLAFNMARAYLTGTGPASMVPGRLTAFLKTDPSVDRPNIQCFFRAVPHGAGPWFPLFRPSGSDGFSCRPVMLHPESRGEITLASADPRDKARIRQNFLSIEKDRRVLRDGFKLAREMAMQKPLDPFRDIEVLPGADVQSDDEIDAYIRRTAVTARHPCATCRMGADDGAVLDETLRLRGTEGLRVVDASAMSGLVSGNINAAVLMLAERAADLIRGRNPLPAPAGRC